MAAWMDVPYAISKLAWMRAQGIWPTGRRYLWTDAFGLVLLVSLYVESGKRQYLDQAESLVAEVVRVLGRARGLRIGEAPDRDGQYFHYIAMWLYALAILGQHIGDYRSLGVALVRQIHDAFVQPGRGVLWKMKEDLSAPYPGCGFGALDPFDGYVSYRLLDEKALAPQIADMRTLIEQLAPDLDITQDLGLGTMLWMSQFFPDEGWARTQTVRCLTTLDQMWVEDGYFCREPRARYVKYAFTNYGVSVGLQAVNAMPERIRSLNAFFETYRSGDAYDRDAITHVMACSSHFPGYLVRGFPVSQNCADRGKHRPLPSTF
jgi:hypothetical protein